MVNTLLEATLVGFFGSFFLNVVRYWLIHQVGYWVFLPVLAVGMIFSWIADVVLAALEQTLGTEHHGWISYLDQSVVLPVTLAVSTSILANALIGRERSSRLAAKWRGNLMECLMQDSSGLVELTLETGKSYVGRVIESGIWTSNDSDVSIMPIFSGHRDQEHQLQLTTSYIDPLLQEASSKALNEGGTMFLSEFVIVLRKSRIVSARPFDLRAFATRLGRSLPGSSV